MRQVLFAGLSIVVLVAAALALQLLCWEMSESMGNHDSNVVGRVC
jgi:hypothetical protein